MSNSNEFSEQSQLSAEQAGIDIEKSYKCLQLEIKLGGPVAQRLIMAIDGLNYKNADGQRNRNLTDHHGSLYDAIPGAEKRKTCPLSPAELRALNGTIIYGNVPNVAAAFDLSPQTIKDQLSSARLKLGAKNITNAVAIAIRRGLL